MLVDIYCRVSTDPQEDNTSLDEQERAGREFCAENNLIVGLVHREVFSGFQYREREELDLMRHRYCEGKIQGVVIRTLDRLSRSQVHNAILMEEMEHHNITLYSVKENIDDTPMGKFIHMVLAFVAEVEREKIMDRSTTGRINKAKEGKVVSGSKAPYGWTWLYDENGEKIVIINEEQAEIVRWIYEEYAKGVSSNSLKTRLNAQGVPSPSGKNDWNERGVSRILSDRRLTGKGAKLFAYQNRKTKQPLEPVDLPDGTYPAIISEESFAAVQEHREINKARAIGDNQQPEEYLLRAGFVKCAYCNKPMAAVKHRSNYTYQCTHHDLNHTNVILSKPLDEQIWQWLQQLSNHTTLIEKAVEIATRTSKIQEDMRVVERSIARWRVKVQNYLIDLDDSTLINDTRTAVRNALNTANKMVLMLEEEQAQIIAIMADKDREKAAYQDILVWCKKAGESREELTYQQKRDFLGLVGVVVIIENKKPFYENMTYRVEVALPTIQELLLRW